MPLKLVPPRPGHPNYYIRGSYLTAKKLFISTGTPDKQLAQKALAKKRRDIESGAYAAEKGPTFLDATVSYIRASGQIQFIMPIAEHFGRIPLAKIDQAAVDEAALKLFPGAKYSPATRNRQVYCVVSAILKHAGIDKRLKRPKGGKGKRRLHWLRPDPLLALLAAAEAVDVRFGAFCTFLFYTGCRRSEGLRLTWDDVHLQESSAWVGRTKNGDPRMCFLPPVVVASLANLPRVDGDPRVFRLCANNVLARMLEKASELSGTAIPDGIAFHIFRHSYGALMRRQAGLDTSGLVATGAWKSEQAARVYEHVEFSEEATKAVLLPVAGVRKACASE